MFNLKLKSDKVFNLPNHQLNEKTFSFASTKVVQLTRYRALIPDNNNNVDSDGDYDSCDIEKSKVHQTDKQSSYVRQQIIGHGLYVDTTASGRSARCIEDFIRNCVLPFYANTHTTISQTSFLTTSYREEARQVIRNCVGTSEDDVCIFSGFGSTSCVHKLIHCLNIVKQEVKPIVLVGPYEHHSNLLPWRETGAQIINLKDDSSGSVDEQYLEMCLKKITSSSKNKGRSIYGVFSAGSNVTGCVSDDIRITKLLHKYGGFCFFDYSAAAPHVKIEMNPWSQDLSIQENEWARKDALYFSGHKFFGGPQTTGILIAKGKMFSNPVPHHGGGGTVFFVTPDRHSYLKNIEEAEEGGTPGIVEAIRLGLVFSLKRDIGDENICARESFFTKKALKIWSATPNLIIVGSLITPRLPIISFVIKHAESGFYLHQNFVVALLNDLFGIQCRGGCMCAGVYSQHLLGMDKQLTDKYEKILSTDCRKFSRPNEKTKGPPIYHLIFKPGYTRISFPFEISMEQADFVIKTVQMIAQDGWKLLPQYRVCVETGLFQHFSKINTSKIQDLQLLCLSRPQSMSKVNLNLTPAVLLKAASEIFNSATIKDYDGACDGLNPDAECLRWFMLPRDAVKCMQSQSVKIIKLPFEVNVDRYQLSPNRVKSNTFTPKSIPFQLQNDTCSNK